jgi:UDP-N-acetylmuramate-alanine ligase
VLAVLLASDVPLDAAVTALRHLQPPAERMQRLGGAGRPLVVVDYAHAPDALEKVLTAWWRSRAANSSAYSAAAATAIRGSVRRWVALPRGSPIGWW